MGSSSSTTSNRLSSSAASAARAAWPPDSEVISGVRADVEAEVGQHRREPLVEVRGAAGQPVVEAARVRVLGGPGVRPAPSAGGGLLHGGGRGGGAGAAGDVAADGLAGDPLVLLRQPADEGVGRARS